jgi:hypothetical protein
MIADAAFGLSLSLWPPTRAPGRRRRSKRKRQEAREFLSRRKLHERLRDPGGGLDAAAEASPNELIKAKPAKDCPVRFIAAAIV